MVKNAYFGQTAYKIIYALDSVNGKFGIKVVPKAKFPAGRGEENG